MRMMFGVLAKKMDAASCEITLEMDENELARPRSDSLEIFVYIPKDFLRDVWRGGTSRLSCEYFPRNVRLSTEG